MINSKALFSSFYIALMLMTACLAIVSFPVLLKGPGGKVAYAGCDNPTPGCSGGGENPACCPAPDDGPCNYDAPDYTNPNCADAGTHDQMDGGFKFPGNTFKSYGQGIITAGSGIILGLAVLKVIFGGVMYATAAGNPQRIEEAKSHIYYAMLGIALLVGMNVILALLGAETY